MEGNGETSDTDSGIILHSGSDSPTTTTKDVTTYTRAMKLKHQSLQDRLQLCVLELKELCIREAELTGRLSADYPLDPGESPPKVRRRIGASFPLDEQSIPCGPEESELNLVDAELALQLKIYEAARRLCREEHQNKAVRKSRLQQCKREERRVKELQESAFRLRLQHGRSSPLPAFTVPLQEPGISDDSSLSDSPVLDEDVPQPQSSAGPPGGDQNPLPQDFPDSSPTTSNSSVLSSSVASQPHTPIKRTPSLLTPSQLTPSQLTPGLFTPGWLTPRRAGSPGLDSMLSFSSNPETEAPPILPSPWSESSLDQPFQKTKKNRSSTKSSTRSSDSSQLLPPLEACLSNAGLPRQLSQLRLSDSPTGPGPTPPEARLHRHLSLRISNPETPLEERRGRTRSARRRLTDYIVRTPENAGGNPAVHYGTPENVMGNPAVHYGTPENAMGNPAEHYGRPENVMGKPAVHYGRPENVMGNPAEHYGRPENVMGNPAEHYGRPENVMGNPAEHYGRPENVMGNPAEHYGRPENVMGNPAEHYGTPENSRRNPAAHYGRPENSRRNPAAHYGTPENAMGSLPFHYGTQENSEDSQSEHSWTTRVGSVCQRQQGPFPRAGPLQYPGPTGGPGPHAFQNPRFYQNPSYQYAPGFPRSHYGGDVAQALDLARGPPGLQAPPHRRDYMYAEAPRRAPQDVRLGRSPSLWGAQRCRSSAAPPPQLVGDQLKSWHHRNQFRGARPRSLDRQGAVRVKTVADWGSPLAHRYQEQVVNKRVHQRPADDQPGGWLGDDTSKVVTQV